MKKMFILFFMLFSLVIPCGVEALTEEGARDILDELPIVFNDDGSSVFNIESIPFPAIWERTCNTITREEIIERNPWLVSLGYDIDAYLESAKTSCRDEIVLMYFEDLSYRLTENEYVIQGAYLSDSNMINTYIMYEDENEDSGYNSIIVSSTANFHEIDEGVRKEVDEITGELAYLHVMSGLNSLSSFYHYGYVLETDTEPLASLYRFDNIKKVLRNHPNFTYSIPTSGGGSTPYFAGMNGTLNIYRNGVFYGAKQVSFEFNTIITVDKNLPGTVFEKAENRIEGFFKNRIDVTVDSVNYTKIDDTDMFFMQTVNNTFGTTNESYVGYHTTVSVNGEEFDFVIVEVDTELLDEYEVISHHKGTGIHVYTKDFEVPKDSDLNISNEFDKVKKQFNKNYNVKSAYNIDVVKGDGNFVKQIEDGIDVFMPTIKHNAGDKVDVYHIDNDKVGEKFEGTVVDVDGNKYIKFRTTHFSTYAVMESLETNPNTSDNIISSLLLIVLALGGMFTIYKFKPNFSKK